MNVLPYSSRHTSIQPGKTSLRARLVYACLTLLLISVMIVLIGCSSTTSSGANAATPTRWIPSLSDSFNQTFSEHYTIVNGVRYHYVTGGHGAPVVFLHGWPETWYAWHFIMPTLAQHYMIIAPDMRGLGDTAKPTSGYDERTVATDIYALVQSLGLRQVSLVGHDLGADVAYAYADMHPTDVQRLVTLGATIIDKEYLQIPALARPVNYLNFTFNSTPAPLPEQLTAGRERIYLEEVSFKKLAHSQTAISKTDIDEYVRHYAAPGGMHAGFEWYRAFFQDVDETAMFAQKKLSMPVLVIGDQLIKNSGELQMRTLATNVRGVVADQSGHFVAEEQPEFLMQQLQQFLPHP